MRLRSRGGAWKWAANRSSRRWATTCSRISTAAKACTRRRSARPRAGARSRPHNGVADRRLVDTRREFAHRERELTEIAETNSTQRHGGRTEGLWPARLRRAGRTRPPVRNASAPVSFRAFAFRTADLVRAARSAAPQAFCHAAVVKLF